MKNQLNLLIVAAIMMFLSLGCFGPDGRGSSEEGSAIASLRMLHGAQFTYQATAGGVKDGEGNFAGSFDQLVNLGLIDNKFKGVEPQKNRYIFSMKVVPNGGTDRKAKFSVNADPMSVGSFTRLERFLGGAKDPQERRHFYIDESGVIHHNKGRSATAADPALEAYTDYHSKPPADQIAYLTEQLKKSDWYQPRFERAAAYFKLHKATEAVEDMKQGVRMFSAHGEKAITNLGSPTEVRGWTDSLRGQLRYHLGKLATYQEAAGDYTGAASAYEQMFSLPTEALGFNKQLYVTNNPDLNNEHLHYWFVLTKSGQSQKANEFLEKQVSLVRKDSNWLVIAKFLLGKQNEADFLKEKTVTEYVDGKARDLEGALFFAGMKRSLKGDESGAKLFYKRFLEKNKNPSAGHFQNFNEIQLAQYYLNETIDF